MAGAITARNKYDSCKHVAADLTEVSGLMIKDYSTTQIMTNSMTALWSSFSNFTTFGTSLYSSDFKTIGKLTGEFWFNLFGNEKIAQTLKDKAAEEKKAFEEKIAKSHVAFNEINV